VSPLPITSAPHLTATNCSIVKVKSNFHCEFCDDKINEYICCNHCEHKFCRSCLINHTIHNDGISVCPFCGIDFNYEFSEDHILNNILYGKNNVFFVMIGIKQIWFVVINVIILIV